MKHFHIEHIDDVLPHIANNPEFVVAQRPGYTVIDYQFAGPDTFGHPARLECRGLKFGPDGRIIARPLHKFFNVGEKPDTQPGLLDFEQPHTIMEKLDGSMIHPAIVDGQVRFMTRMGCTDHARKAERHLNQYVLLRCMEYLSAGFTPIFEWTAPDNRIVVSYPESKLTLLAVRNTNTGWYLPQHEVDSTAFMMGVSPAPIHTPRADFLEHARAIRGLEGFVVRFASGLWVKAKGEDYVLKHKAKESVLQEKNVLALVLRGELDDVLTLLEPSDRAEVERYRDHVQMGVDHMADTVNSVVVEHARLDQKAFATQVVPLLSPALRAIAFRVRAGGDPRDTVVATILKQCGSASGVRSARPLFGTNFHNDNAMQAAA